MTHHPAARKFLTPTEAKRAHALYHEYDLTIPQISKRLNVTIQAVRATLGHAILSSGPRLLQPEIDTIARLAALGLGPSEISRKLERPAGTISNHLRALRKAGRIPHPPRSKRFFEKSQQRD